MLIDHRNSSYVAGKLSIVLTLAVMVLAGLAVPVMAADKAKWVTSWASAQMVPGNDGVIPEDMRSDVTIRQVVRVSMGGKRLRIRISNVFGNTPLTIGATNLARTPDNLSTRIEDPIPLSFGGQANVQIPPGAEYISDPVDMPVTALERLAISMFLPQAGSPQTGHPGARTQTWLVSGNHVADLTLENPKVMERWFHVAGVEVEAPKDARAVALIGDSITDGYGVKAGTYARWSDVLAERLQAENRTRKIAVLNQGIGGGRILNHGLGPNAVSRFERDVLGQAGIRYVIVFEGVNDLGGLTRNPESTEAEYSAMAGNLIAAYRQMILRAHAKDIKIYGATILPFMGNEYYSPTARVETIRVAVNDWIRNSGEFDAVIDLDRLMADPSKPDHLKPEFDSGDHLHPSMAGYKEIGNAIPLALFK